MASAAAAPTGSYANAFSWRIFGITAGDQQLGFSSGANGNRVLGYSGAVTAGDISSLAGLAQLGDRLTKLTLTFTYGSTDPDVGLALITASDYQEIQYSYQYVQCSDAGVVSPIDAFSAGSKNDAASFDVLQPQSAPDAVTVVDFGVARFDAQPVPNPDAGVIADSGALVADARIADARVADVHLSADTGTYSIPDAGTKHDTPPVLAGGKDAAPAPAPSTINSGCSVATGSTSGGYFALALAGLLIAARLRKRRSS
jgi:MYXO-CTERM domain-containing protein